MQPKKRHRICSRCVLDTTVPSIIFDDDGVCNYCKSHDRLVSYYPKNDATRQKFKTLLANIRRKGRNRAYDCIVGVSGGTDSSYALTLAVESGLRPLAVHFDNGWNANEAVTNIENIINILGVDLYTHVVDWEEFKNLQRAFLKASVPGIEVPTDVGIFGALMKTANREGVKYILGGQSFATEGTVPREWSYIDGTYIKSVHKQFGSLGLKSFPNLTLPKIFYYTFFRGIRQIPILNYIDYSKETAKKILEDKFGWHDYGGHHYENIYSKFAFGWFQYRKFDIDKRKVSLSGAVRSGMMTKSQALEILKQPPDVQEDLVEYCIRKLGLTPAEFDEIMKIPPKSYGDYFTGESILKHFKTPIKMATRMGIFTPVLYEKYFL